MPSSPNANSPFMESRLQATFGVKAPGSPSSAGKPGVQAADVSFPAPPSPASAPPGRPAGPSATPTPAPIPPPPPPPPAPAPATAPAAPKPDGGGQSAGGEMWPNAQAPQQPQQAGGEMWPNVSAPAPAPAPPAPSVVAGVTALNQPQLSLTPEGEQRYRQLVVRTREALGPMPNVFRMAGMPEMPVEPGRFNYNPFTGSWSK